MQDGGKAIVCSEVVRLDGPTAGDGLASMAASLLLPDLPVFLMWVAPPDFERPVFRALRTLATRAGDRLDAVPRHPRPARAR